MIGGDEVVERLPALAGRAPTSGYLFYDCQTDDSRLVLTVLAEAERFGAVCANRMEVTELARRRRAHARRLRARRAERRALRAARRQRGQRHRRVGRPAAPRGAARRGRGAAHPPLARARTSRSPHETLPLGGRGDRPRRRRARDLRPAVAGLDAVGTTDNDYDADDLDHVRPAADDVDYLLEADNAFFGADARARGHHRRLRRRAPADLHRRPEEVGRHLAQGRALRDLQRDDHHHRRQADDVAADGEDGRRPAGRARGPRRARAARTRSRSASPSTPATCRGSRACPKPPTSASPPATATRPTTSWPWPARAASWPSRSCPAGPPELLAEAVHAARREQARQRGRRAAAPHAPRAAGRARRRRPGGRHGAAGRRGHGHRAGVGRRGRRNPPRGPSSTRPVPKASSPRP